MFYTFGKPYNDAFSNNNIPKIITTFVFFGITLAYAQIPLKNKINELSFTKKTDYRKTVVLLINKKGHRDITMKHYLCCSSSISGKKNLISCLAVSSASKNGKKISGIKSPLTRVNQGQDRL